MSIPQGAHCRTKKYGYTYERRMNSNFSTVPPLKRLQRRVTSPIGIILRIEILESDSEALRDIRRLDQTTEKSESPRSGKDGLLVLYPSQRTGPPFNLNIALSLLDHTQSRNHAIPVHDGLSSSSREGDRLTLNEEDLLLHCHLRHQLLPWLVSR
ncbi:hypothetical protein BV22DRAFT_1049450 [Leucogyrophana mollusca]|uniref:Uncharacterized protein n=1 Tax=Leucogyrophana mollusca TaxID=85980 RepID=A0ACB8B7R5_9AGAM|nr:hypothetical protein BV22DRAFT_1049450 [Leucogyrophana mollusca]